jgi:ATP phosphoribosyltransferase regulatory subunit
LIRKKFGDDMENEFLKKEERVALSLKKLYKSYGYQQFKLSGFEEYALYTRNIDFLTRGKIATFNMGGRLLSLRPDVTLSIIKNIKLDGTTQKIFYEENVYRVPLGGEDLHEVKQLGAEIIGAVDLVAEAEMVELAVNTLAQTGGNYVLDIAHMGIISAFFDEFGLNPQDTKVASEFLRHKNAHEFLCYAEQKGIPQKVAESFVSLMQLDGKPHSALEKVQKICINSAMENALKELKTLVDLLGKNAEHTNINFSIVGNDAYYNGLIFKGYVEGIPHSVLSGGRYDKLLEKFEKKGQAIGFALYLGDLCRLYKTEQKGADITIIYNATTGKQALAKAQKLRAEGKSVLLTTNANEAQGKIMKAEDLT